MNLHCDLPNPSPFVKADPARLQQILWNLLKNAVKFTPERGDISVSVLPTVENRVRLQVRDSGIGMAADVLPCIFDAFEQGDDDITQEFGGMGLGLADPNRMIAAGFQGQLKKPFRPDQLIDEIKLVLKG
jgi:signal transduction histidine kinase